MYISGFEARFSLVSHDSDRVQRRSAPSWSPGQAGRQAGSWFSMSKTMLYAAPKGVAKYLLYFGTHATTR